MDAQISAKESEMEIELVFHEKHMIHITRNFNDFVDDNLVLTAEESFRINYFLYMVNQVISSIQNEFKQFTSCKKLFGFLFNFERSRNLS